MDAFSSNQPNTVSVGSSNTEQRITNVAVEQPALHLTRELPRRLGQREGRN